MAELNKEIWLAELMEDFVPSDAFLSEARDMSAFVENDKINLSEAGALPKVLVNNTTYPIPTNDRVDKHLSVELDNFSTESTILRHADLIELAYDKLQSVIYGHKESLRRSLMERAIHGYAPSKNATYSPVIKSTEASITFDHLLELEEAFDQAEIPQEGRVLVLSVAHKTDLRKADMKIYKDIFSHGNGRFGSFKLYTLADSRMPVYNKNTGNKKAFGAAAAAGTDTIASVAFQKDEVMRAIGTYEMFYDQKNPDEQGDKVNFFVRAKAQPIRDKGIGAIFTS